ncbi:MAG: flippase-like domain-containing protein [Candidatus Omnitrophica bacterium]|nr:flippase-like domain-containing protein [Candidatus Omnitrophota bacterium]
MNKAFIIRLCISAIIIYLLFKFKIISIVEVFTAFRESKKIYIFYGLLISFFNLIICAFRWKYLLFALGIKRSYSEVFKATFAGLFFNLAAPSVIAGDIYRGFSISVDRGQIKKTALSVIIDRFSGFFALTLVAFISFILGKDLIIKEKAILLIFLFGLLVFFIFFLFFNEKIFSFFLNILNEKGKVKSKLLSIYDELSFFRKSPFIFFKSLYFSIPIQILAPLSFWITAKGFGCDAKIIYFLIFTPLVMFVALIPISIGGLGTTQAAAVFFFNLAGIDKNVSVNISLLNSAFTILFGFIGGLVYIFLPNSKKNGNLHN